MTYGLLVTYLIIGFGTINLIRIVFFMIGSDIYFLKQALRKKYEKDDGNLPIFTVVIPAHNEEDSIERSIQSVLLSNYPKSRLQVLVVDDGSKDMTLLLAKYYEQFEYDFRVIHQENSGKAHALNNAIQNYATGELVMCLDADSMVHPDALLNAAKYFRDPKVVALSSNVKIRRTDTLFNLIQMFEYIVCYQMKRAHTIFNIEYIIGGIGSTFRYSTLAKVGFYDTDTITEDIDLTMKFLQLGNRDHRVIYGSDVITYTESVLDLKGLIRQRFRWKYGRCQTFIKNVSLFFSRDERHGKHLSWFYLPYALFSDFAFFFEPFMVSYLLYIVIRYGDWVSLLSAFIVVSVYIMLNIVAEDSLTLKERAKLIIIAPSMYFFFYLLSCVEYLALLKTYLKFWEIPKSIEAKVCGWEHVERAKV